MLEKPSLNALQEVIVCSFPYLFIEYLDFNGAVVAGCIYKMAQLSQCDDTVTHHGASHQDSEQRHRPVGDVEAHDSSTRTLDLLYRLWVPPDMEGIDDDTCG